MSEGRPPTTLTHSLTRSLAHSLTHSLTRSLIHSFTELSRPHTVQSVSQSDSQTDHSVTHSLTHSLSHSLIHSLTHRHSILLACSACSACHSSLTVSQSHSLTASIGLYLLTPHTLSALLSLVVLLLLLLLLFVVVSFVRCIGCCCGVALRRGVVVSWCRGVVVSWCRGVVVSWCRGVVVLQCCCVSVSSSLLCCGVAVLPCCRVVVRDHRRRYRIVFQRHVASRCVAVVHCQSPAATRFFCRSSSLQDSVGGDVEDSDRVTQEGTGPCKKQKDTTR